jgi:hypothetical protein
MSERIMRRRLCRWNLPATVAVAWFYLWSGADRPAGCREYLFERNASGVRQATYEQVLEQLAKLEGTGCSLQTFAG